MLAATSSLPSGEAKGRPLSVGDGPASPAQATSTMHINPSHAPAIRFKRSFSNVTSMPAAQVTRLFAGHFGTAPGTGHLIAWLPCQVGHFVAAIWAHAVATWPGCLGAAHTTRSTTTSAAGTTSTAGTATAATASAKKPLEHRSHLLLQIPSVEQGGLSQRSSRPQQVSPAGRLSPLIT